MAGKCGCVRDERGVKTELCESCRRIKAFKAMNSSPRGTWSENLLTPTVTAYTSRKDFER